MARPSTIKITPYEVGKFYRVPVVRYEVYGFVSDWPVLGPWHEDAKYIGFENEHYHLDLRFLTRRQLELIDDRRGRPFSYVLQNKWHDPFGNTYHSEVFEYLGLKRKKCQRVYPQFPFQRATWIPVLEKAYRHKRLGPCLRCPHKGASLEGMPVRKGVVTCALHGLRFSVKTGELVTT